MHWEFCDREVLVGLMSIFCASQRYLADVISVLALTMSEDGDRVSCPYQLPFLFACLPSAQTVSPILSSGQNLSCADIVSLFHLNTLTKSMCVH
jgi:hypothetical protein